jgi:hypothetical protein
VTPHGNPNCNHSGLLPIIKEANCPDSREWKNSLRSWVCHSDPEKLQQIAVSRRSRSIDGLVLSGSGALDRLARLIRSAPPEANILNARFVPARTPFDCQAAVRWSSTRSYETPCALLVPSLGSSSRHEFLGRTIRGGALLAASSIFGNVAPTPETNAQSREPSRMLVQQPADLSSRSDERAAAASTSCHHSLSDG